jgi:hypothetical protein
MRTLLVLFMLGLATLCRAQAFYEDFEGPFPPDDWMLGDGAGTGVLWGANADWGHANWTGGTGACAELCTDGDPTDYDAWLRTPVFTVPEDGHLYARVNYQNLAGEDRFEVYVVIGLNTYTWAEYASDIGGFYGLPGEWIDVDISMWHTFDIQVAFHYYDPEGSPGDDWYCQIDDVTVGDESAVQNATWGAIKALYR